MVEFINHIYQNPMETGLVFRAEDYRYSSVIDYSDEKGLLECLTFKERPYERICAVAGETRELILNNL